MSTADPRASFASYLERLERSGFRPSRRLGQNFLLEPALHRAVAEAAAVNGADLALEIGGGLGFLTRELAATAAAVVVVEIDPRLASLLREDFGAREELRLVECDALGPSDTLAEPIDGALGELRLRHPRAKLRVAANLPYAISGPLLVALAVREGVDAVESMGVLVQYEVAERLSARPGSGEYGSLPALLQSLFQVRIERRVGPEVFRPRPRVDSAIVSLRARADVDPALAGRRGELARFLRALFHGRRKTMRHALDRLVPDWTARVAEPSVLGASRAEALAPERLVELFVELGAHADRARLDSHRRPS